MPKRRVLPKTLQQPHPPIHAATGSPETHREIGELGLGLLSFGVGTPPEEIKRKIDIYRSGIAECKQPVGAYLHDHATVFAMVNCMKKKEDSYAVSRESFEWYGKYGAELIATLPRWLDAQAKVLGDYDWLGEVRDIVGQGLHHQLTFEYLNDTHGCIAGDPDEVVEHCRLYADTGADLLLCLVNPYKVPHDAVMETIELMGKYVIPEFN